MVSILVSVFCRANNILFFTSTLPPRQSIQLVRFILFSHRDAHRAHSTEHRDTEGSCVRWDL